jgi:hypothetical protein
MGIYMSTTSRPIDETVGAKAIRHALETNADTEALVAAINAAMARIDRGLDDHFHHPVIPPGQTLTDTLLDITNNLHKALDETRQRLEEGLRQLDERRGET